jgi:hypothetical protein
VEARVVRGRTPARTARTERDAGRGRARGGSPVARGTAATASATLLDRIRRPGSTLAFLVLVAAATLALPPAGAPYATLTVGKQPVLLDAASRGVLTAAVLVVLAALPALLAFVSGTGERTALRLAGLTRTFPGARFSTAWGRFAANAVTACIVVGAAGALLTAVDVSRTDPHWLAFAAAFLIVALPAALAVAGGGALADAVLPASPGVRVTAAIALWLLFLGIDTIPGRWTALFDMGAVWHAISATTALPVAVGIAPVSGRPLVLAAPLAIDGVQRALLALCALAAGALAGPLLRWPAVAFGAPAAQALPAAAKRGLRYAAATVGRSPLGLLLSCVRADLAIAARSRKMRFAFAAAIGAAAASLAAPPLATAAAMLAPILALTAIPLPDAYFGTEWIVRGAPFALRRYALWKVLAVLACAVVLQLPLLVRLAALGAAAPAAMLAWDALVACVAVTIAVRTGSLVGGLAFAGVSWYLLAFGNAPPGLDFPGVHSAPDLGAASIAVGIGVLCTLTFARAR